MSRRDVVREMRTFRRRMADVASRFPPPNDFGYEHFKLPLSQDLVSPPHARLALQARAAQVLIDTAAALAKLKPKEAADVRVTVVLSWPQLFDSEVCFFFDPAYFAGFTRRDDPDDRWTPRLAGDSLAARLGLALPAGFTEWGFDVVRHDPSCVPPWSETLEVWLIGELG